MKCPKCHTVLNVEGLSGVFACPQCGQKLSLGSPTPALATVRAVSPPPPQPAIGISTEEGTTVRKQTKSTGIVALLDLRFERYLTPLILRIYWVLALIAASIAIIGACISWYGEMFPAETRKERGQFEFRVPATRSEGLERPKPSETSREIARFFYNSKEAIYKIIIVIAGILFVRIFCESMIVLFDISTTLKAIDKRGKTLNN